jgi:CDP-glycerol glycerophosphotransferase (TagB/SpsB family)
MKIDRGNPIHWLLLTAFGLNCAVAMVLRHFVRHRGRRRTVVLYGHKLAGNLLAIYCKLREEYSASLDVKFLSLDPGHARELRRRGEACVSATSPGAIATLIRADAVISDHGLHSLQTLLRRSSIKFFDVWHGIPFKGFDADDFKVQRRYTESWVASPLLKRLYVERFGFEPSRVAVTGYARTDRLVTRDEDTFALRRKFGLPERGKLILFAPTWKQDTRSRSIFPFENDEVTFLGALSALAERNDATILMRTHLNTGTAIGLGFPHVVPVPFGTYPDTEGILLVSDVLICDWSSIAFDFLLLDRPTLFLDVPAPFAKGFSLGPEYRFGEVVAGLDALVASLDAALGAPNDYQQRFAARHADVRRKVYGDFADGHAADRCLDRLAAALTTPGSSR